MGALLLKNKGEYCCDKCGCISNVVISRSLYGLASGTCVLALLILVLYSYFGNHGNILGVLLVLLPFIVFYSLVPFFVHLEPCIDKSAERKIIVKRQTAAIENTLDKIQIPSKNINPIELNVSDDFSKNFIQAKNMVEQEHKINTENDESQNGHI